MRVIDNAAELEALRLRAEGEFFSPPSRLGRSGDSQGMPVAVEGAPDIQSQVIADIEKRREVGISRYGTALQANNGRDALLDLYEELLDACMYCKQMLVEIEALDLI